MKKISSGTPPPPRSEDERPKEQEQAEENVLSRNKKDNHGLAAGTAKNHDGMTKLERKTTEDINESAEAFIQKFRQQLMIQRLESIENYEQMLARGL
ncbi:pathogen-associated molecular patterns-induced protein A70 [Rhodamnia argentea]|uniref:Pathogen-associated molecular patterns-induced protein A70 n=1 Tax=Rhodamnia argentea TaxID=178133 RepID=A0A8B8NRT4_9MYRT|nr:pathogen-associated molecular patterns-induced protein A70 [Rhodamnia argentea]